MQTFVLVALLVGSASAIPAKLDHLLPPRTSYNYQPPPQPSGLYELPHTTTTPPPPPPPPPSGYLPPVESVVQPVVKPTPGPAKPMMLMPYEFNYAVDDNEYGTKFSHTEDSDGQYVTGEYSVLLPDGRTQVVRFTSDPINGYRAEVTYH